MPALCCPGGTRAPTGPTGRPARYRKNCPQHDGFRIIVSQDIHKKLAEKFNLSGPDIAYIEVFAGNNLSHFAGSIGRLVGLKRWEEIEDGARKVKCFAENMEIENLAGIGFALTEAARQKNVAAVLKAQRDLHAFLRNVAEDSPCASDTAPLHIEPLKPLK